MMSFNYEGEMFEKLIQNFVKTKGTSSTFGHAIHKGVTEKNYIKMGWPLIINKYCIPPDVYGIDGNSKIHLCQGKLIKNRIGKLWNLLAQCISNRKYGHFIYAFFSDQDLNELMKNEEIFEDFKEILTTFKFGLITLSKSPIDPMTIVEAQEQLISQKRESFVRQKIKESIKNDKNLELFISKLLEELGQKPLFIKRLFLNKTQPAFYIYLNRDQKILGLNYLIKFVAEGIRVGLNITHNRFNNKVYNKIITNPHYQFSYYNKKKISEVSVKDIKKDEMSKIKTHDFYNIIEHPPYTQFFSSIESKETQVIMNKISLSFKELVSKLKPHLNTFNNNKKRV